VIDTRLRRLAYAPEIAGEMLRRQQASAVVAARSLMIESAVGMVKHALTMLAEESIVELDEERKAQMVSNLLVVLVSDKGCPTGRELGDALRVVAGATRAEADHDGPEVVHAPALSGAVRDARALGGG
jgi:hypothetical protein